MVSERLGRLRIGLSMRGGHFLERNRNELDPGDLLAGLTKGVAAPTTAHHQEAGLPELLERLVHVKRVDGIVLAGPARHCRGVSPPSRAKRRDRLRAAPGLGQAGELARRVRQVAVIR